MRSNWWTTANKITSDSRAPSVPRTIASCWRGYSGMAMWTNMPIDNRLLTVSKNREAKHTNVTCDDPYHFMTMVFARNTMVASKWGVEDHGRNRFGILSLVLCRKKLTKIKNFKNLGFDPLTSCPRSSSLTPVLNVYCWLHLTSVYIKIMP
jgi:hypothetical protein